MALRIRKNYEVVCAAQTFEQDGDIYIDDAIHGALAEHFRKPETEEDRQWADLYYYCMVNGIDPRMYWCREEDKNV